MLAGMISRPAAISSRISATGSFSRSATKAISSVTWPRRAKCICDMLESPVRAASSFRFTIHSARGLRISCVPFPLLLIVDSPLGRIIRLDAELDGRELPSYPKTSDAHPSANFTHWRRSDHHPEHHCLFGCERRERGQKLLRHHRRAPVHG